jgi:hypothetical protein
MKVLSVLTGAIVLSSALAGDVKAILAQHVLSNSEAYRADGCTGDYVRDEDGSWATGNMSVARGAVALARSAAHTTAGEESVDGQPLSLAQRGSSESAVADGAFAGQRTHLFSILCTARDHNYAALIQQHVGAQDADPDRLADMLAVLAIARKACAQGRVNEGLALYDSIKLRPVSAEK